MKLKNVEQNKSAERPSCSHGRLVRNRPGVVQGFTNRKERTKWLA